MRNVDTRNRVDNLVVREEVRSKVQEGTSRRSPRKRSKDWKNGIRVMRCHGKHVICRWNEGNAQRRAEKKQRRENAWHDVCDLWNGPKVCRSRYLWAHFKMKQTWSGSEWRGLGIVGCTLSAPVSFFLILFQKPGPGSHHWSNSEKFDIWLSPSFSFLKLLELQ